MASDYLQESAQSLLQLVGAKGCALNHIAGHAVVDSRPFQIFEGPNDVPYAQVGAKLADQMRRTGASNLREQLARDETTAAGADIGSWASRLHRSLSPEISADPSCRAPGVTSPAQHYDSRLTRW